MPYSPISAIMFCSIFVKIIQAKDDSSTKITLKLYLIKKHRDYMQIIRLYVFPIGSLRAWFEGDSKLNKNSLISTPTCKPRPVTIRTSYIYTIFNFPTNDLNLTFPIPLVNKSPSWHSIEIYSKINSLFVNR